jgi:hypothetical protein
MPPLLATALRTKHRVLPLAAMDWMTAAKTCAALAREAREASEAVEAFTKRIEKIGAIYEMRRYAVTHETALPCVDLTETVRGLRTSAGCLCLMASDLRKQISSDDEKR